MAVITGILNNPPYSIDEAVQRGDAVYEVLYRNWGLGGVGSITQWPDNGQPGVSVSIAGMAIGPRSTVDRCWVSYNLNKFVNPPPTAAADIAALTNRLRRLSVGSPLMFTQPTASKASSNSGVPFFGDNPLLTMTSNGAFYVYPVSNGDGLGNVGHGGYGEYPGQIESTQIRANSSSLLTSFYDINGTARNMNSDTWIGPQLHLVIYLKPPVAGPPTARMPLKVVSQTAINLDGTEQMVQNIATYGRRNVHVMMFCSAGPSNFRVGALRAVGINNIPFLSGLPYEEPFDVATDIAAGTRVVLASCNQDGVYSDFINLYCTPPNSGGQGTVTYVVSAYD